MKILRYKVTVSAFIDEVRFAGKEWATIGIDENGKDVRGYTPEIEKHIQSNQTIFEQTVETLNMPSLVSVVNGLSL